MGTEPTADADHATGADRDAEFAALFSATWTRMFRTAYAVSGDAAAAEDATQTAFAKAYASWPRVRRAERPEAYLRRMVVNEVLGQLRRGWRRRERSRGEELVPERTPAVPGSLEGEVVDRAALWAVVSELPPRQRAVVVLRYYEDLSEAEIAEVLGCRPGTVKSQAAAALATLRRRAAGLDPEEER